MDKKHLNSLLKVHYFSSTIVCIKLKINTLKTKTHKREAFSN